VVLIVHNVEAHLVGRAPHIQIHVVEVGTSIGVEMLIGQVHPDGLVGIDVRKVGIGVFGEKPGSQIRHLLHNDFEKTRVY
jgi:hypothetical protein